MVSTYTEKQVNAVLARFHEDISGIEAGTGSTAACQAQARDGSRDWRPDGIQAAVNGNSKVDDEGYRE